MNTERYKIYIAALLHDIGKLAFRAQHLKAGEGHEILGERFIREFLGKLSVTADDAAQIEQLSKHHSIFGHVKSADSLASRERIEDNIKNSRRPLLSILSTLDILEEDKNQKANGTGDIYYYLPKALSTKNVMPEKAPNVPYESWSINENDIIGQHQELWETLKEEFKLLRNSADYSSFSHSLYYLMFKYTSRVCGAGYESIPDTSLFDHSRAVAAIVNCNTFYQEKYEPGKIVKKYLLMKGDISGIQGFIYSDIDMNEAGSTRGISQRLRGRSFYVALLTDFIADRFVERLDLAEANIVYSGGGHFLMLAPYSDEVINIIRKLEQEINLFLMQHIGQRIGFLIGLTNCGEDLYEDMTKYYRLVEQDLGAKKLQRHLDNLEEVLHDESFELVAEAFHDDQRIGELLPYARFVVEMKVQPEKNDKRLAAWFGPNFGRSLFVVEIESENEEQEYISLYSLIKDYLGKGATDIRVFSLNETNFLKFSDQLGKAFPGVPIAFGFKFVGSHAPKYVDKKREGNIMTFEDLQKVKANASDDGFESEKRELSYPMLSVMRLDVDNLGALFGYGLGKAQSFSRVATLSRELHQFFCGYFNHLAEKYQIYVTYSGGDDAFVVGSWLNTIKFAQNLQKDFSSFTGNNRSVTISAGIFNCDEHYPVAKFAQKAEEAEQKAKKFRNGEKNAVCVFDHVLSWDEFHEMIDFAELLLKYTNSKGEGIVKPNTEQNNNGAISRALVHRLHRLIKSSIRSNRESYNSSSGSGELNVQRLRNATQLKYLLARQGFKGQEIEASQEEFTQKIILGFLKAFNPDQFLENFTVPTQYVLYRTRDLIKS